MSAAIEQIPVDRIFLYEENPRHEPLQSQDEVIAHLCKGENVLALARSIAEKGTNPLELEGVIQIQGSGRSTTKKNYEVWEGNRRICAIKLLNDPELAPSHQRKDFVRLAANYKPIRSVNAVVFSDHAVLKFWMKINHGGQQDGVGRRQWDAQQIERHSGSGRNKLALELLDHAEKLGFISKEERNGKLTTAQRFLGSAIVRDALGINTDDAKGIQVDRPAEDFQKQLGTFIEDLKDGVKVSSRHNKDKIDAYGRSLARSGGITGGRARPRKLAKTIAKVAKSPKKGAPRKPTKVTKIDYDSDLAQAIHKLKNKKIESLYYSICAVPLDEHVPLVTVGVWSFIETLSAYAGRNENTDFLSFFSINRLQQLGLVGKDAKVIRKALEDIQQHGNTTKHHHISALFDARQLANDVATVTQLLIKTAQPIP